MISRDNNFLSALQGGHSGSVPFWFMRQAGRYLPEYRELRAKNKNFLDFCYSPELATEATLQPIRRFGMSAAIIFSDILVIPDALGVRVRFQEGVGPLLEPVKDQAGLNLLSMENMEAKLAPVYAAISSTRAALPSDTALIGFTGSPWTLASYMVEGKGSRDFQSVRALALRQPEFFTGLISLLTDAAAKHAIVQIANGADAIQLFDSWSGVLSETEFYQWVIAPTKKITTAIKAAYPHIPIIGFPRLSGVKTLTYAMQSGVDALSIDGSVTLAFAKEVLQPHILLQGNLDSLLLAEDKNLALLQAKRFLGSLADKAFVFNLAHGILPHTPPDNVQALCDLIRNYKR